MIASTTTHTVDAEVSATLETLRVLADRPDLTQRQLSQALGLSLGKTHYVLHALLDKRLVKIENFNRSNNKLAYAYLLPPSGIKAKARLTREFLSRKIYQFETLRVEIEALRREAETHEIASRDVKHGELGEPGGSTKADGSKDVLRHDSTLPGSHE